MPVSSNFGKSGGHKRVFRTTDKCVQAEMKNKIETARLHLHRKILDRQQTYNKFMVEKDKRQSIRALGNMRKTSGLSIHGVAPEGPNDRVHETSPYFKSYRPLTEKRLVRWRVKESMLQRFLEQEDDLTPPWERDPNEDLGQRFGKMMRILGYGVEDDDMLKKMKQANDPNRSTNIHTANGGSVVDVFECLREDLNEDEGNPKLNTKSHTFPVSAWEEKTSKEYQLLISEPNVWTSNRHTQNTVPIMAGQTEETNDTVPNGMNVKSGGSLRKVRPHTAAVYGQGHAPPRLETRPKSASETAKRKSISNAMSKTEPQTNGKLEVDVGSDNVFTDKGTDASPVQESTVESTNAPKNRSVKEHRVPTRTVSLPASRNGLYSLSRQPSSSVDNQDTSIPDNTDGVTSNNRSSLSLVASILKGKKREPKVTFTGIGETENEQAEESGVSPTGKPGKLRKRHTVTSVQQLIKMHKDPSKLSELDMDNLEDNLEQLSGVRSRNDDMGGLFARMPQNREQQKGKNDILLNKTEKRIAMHAASRQQQKSYSSVDPLDDIIDSDEDEDEDEDSKRETQGRRMPQWKRQLMAEAPPGLFGPKSPSKVVVAMSKSQRRRELDQLVTENISDVKKLTENENARRIRARLHMFFTMRKLNDAVGKISGEDKI